MKGQGRKTVCVELGRDCFIYGSLEQKKEMENDDRGRESGTGEM